MFFSKGEERKIRKNTIDFSDYMTKSLNSGLSFLESLTAYHINTYDYGHAYIAAQEALKENSESEYVKDIYSKLSEMRNQIMESPIFGKRYVITGALFGMERKTAFDLIEFFGGKVSDNPVNDMDVLVVGYCEWSELHNGRPTRKIVKAQKLKEQGRDIEIISDEDFIKRIAAVSRQILTDDCYRFFFSETTEA